MDVYIEMVYLRELQSQCESAAAAVRRMNELLRERQPVEFFREAADFLQHAACISRLLWPAPKGNAAQRARATARGNDLCCALGVDNAHVLRSATSETIWSTMTSGSMIGQKPVRIGASSTT
jgi:hypothetical protein